MLIIPAVDIKGGRCVRLAQGNFEAETVFSEEPVEMARRWEKEGAKRLHVVDLDGARTGKPQNLKIVKRIVEAVSIPVQLGGGIRETETVERLLNLGIDRAIIGTAAVSRPELAKAIFGEFGERIILAIDARDGLVAIKGWQETTEKSAFEFAKEMETLGARRIIFTDIKRDGTLAGPNFGSLKAMVKTVKIPVIASGGVSSVKDIKVLKEMGLEGVIIGRALYTGAIDLKEALEAAG